jgi:PAS domain S-box-containing protein
MTPGDRLRLVVTVARGVARARTDVAAIASLVAEALARELGDGAIVVLEQPSTIVRTAHRRPDAAHALAELASTLPPAAFPGAAAAASGDTPLLPEPGPAGDASPEWNEHVRRFPHPQLLVAPIRTADACLGRAILLRDTEAATGRRFDDDDASTVHACLEPVALALEHAMQLQALARHERLRPSEQRVRRDQRFALRIIDDLFAYVAVLDTSGTLLDVNQSPLAAAGIGVEEVRGKKFWDCWWWAHSSEARERVHDACVRAAHGEVVRYDAIARVAGDRRVVIDFQVAPLYDDEGRITHLVPSGVDITERKRVELELRRSEELAREADRRKDEFIAILAHELRNPLAPVRNAVQILRRLGPADPGVERTRDVIDRQVTHMARLIDDLLDVSRIARGKLVLQAEPCDLAALVRQTAEDHRASLEAAGLSVVVPEASGPAWVEGDPVRLSQMIGNLLHNARRFTEPGGRVEVRTEIDAASRLAVVSVTDTGVGIDPGLLSRLFDPFSQARQDLARSNGGLGLGLALTKGLAELHGGGVAARSEGPGRGSTFALRIPLGKARHEAASHDAPESRRDRGLRILVVEDNEDAAETLGDLLELEGHVVRIAHDGPAAIVAARELRPHVVISDIGLPGELDGYGVARTLRADPALEGVQLIALSGYANDDARRRSREAGFDVHLAKPPDIARLEQTLAAVERR